jgi:hypothetical protein
MRLAKNISLYLILILGTIFLFIGAKYQGAPRSYINLWDLGHIALFTIASYLLIRDWKKFSQKSFWYHLTVITILSITIGILTELIQVNFNRTPDISDLGRDVLGGWIACVFFAPSRIRISKKILGAAKILIILLLLISLFPIIRSLTDEVLAKSQFPLLSGFETQFEIHRWEAYFSKINIDTMVVASGYRSLKVVLSTARYSGIFLKHFPSDWADYSFFKFSIYNPVKDTLAVICRIHDKFHKDYNYHYIDRFNKRLYLKSGWNHISIALNEIKTAPKSRLINLSHIELIGIFTAKLPEQRIIYIDDVKLTP